VRPDHRDLRLPVDRAGQARVQDHFRTHAGEGAQRFREPHVVAVRDAEAADAGDVEDDEIAARRGVLLVRVPGKELAITSDHRAFGIDHRDGVVDLPAGRLEHRTGDQPDAVTPGDPAETVFARTRHRFGHPGARAAGIQFRGEHHVQPRKPPQRGVDFGLHEVRVVAVLAFELQPGDCDSAHLLVSRARTLASGPGRA
jgi:hypothetical protein